MLYFLITVQSRAKLLKRRRVEMELKRVAQRFLALLILGGALVFGMSGVYHEAPWIVAPLFGSVKIELGGRRVAANTETLTARVSKRDLSQLAYLTKLKSADLRGSECYEEITAWRTAHPEVEVLYSVPLPDGQWVDNTASELNLTAVRSEQTSQLLDAIACMPNIREVYLGEVGGERLNIQSMREIREVLPGADFHFSAVIGGKLFDGEAETLDLRDIRHEQAQDLAVVLGCMNRLKSVELGSDATGSVPWEDIALLKSNCADVRFRYSFTLYGQALDLDTERLDFRGTEVTDNGNALYAVLSCMNNCTYLDMDSTGVSNESLARLQELFPKTRIVWRVWFGENYSVRTDAEKILASKPTVGGMIYDASVLQYCTDIKYLDLGHNDDLADLSFAAKMPKLEVLIIAMTAITDLSPLRSCPNLEYVELNSTNIADLTPLENAVGLHHLNIAGCPNIRDITPLYNLVNLERLWIGRDTPVPEEQAQKMRELVPGCKVNTTTDDPHGDAWRFTAYDPEEPKYYWVPRYELLREQMGYNYQEYSFYWLDPLCDLEAPEEYRGMYGKEVYGL